jgi:hypothetical protein
MNMDKIEAPWTPSQVASLNAFQKSQHFQPITDRKENGEEVPLIATEDGWVECYDGPVLWTWAYAWMADWSWRELY